MTNIGPLDKAITFNPEPEAVTPAAPANRAAGGGAALPAALAPLAGALDGVLRQLVGDYINASQLNAEEWQALTPDLGVPASGQSAPGSSAPGVSTDEAVAAGSPTMSGRNAKLNQLSPEYANARLGTGDRTIKRAGCFLASLTMAGNRLTGADDDLITSNQKVVNGGGFSDSDLNVPKAAKALGMNLQSRSAASPESMSAAQEALQSGNRLVVAGVDYKPGESSAISAADHFLLLTGPKDRTADGNTLTAVDPAGGRDLIFRRQPDGSFACGKYTITEVSVLAATASTPKLATRRIPG